MDERTQRTLGTVGLGAAVVLLVGNLAHPFDGTTQMYGDVTLFMQKMTTFWIVDHLVLALPGLIIPLLIWGCAQSLHGSSAALWGTAAWMLGLAGTVVGILHVGGIDGVALPAHA